LWDWAETELSVGTIDRCIREAGIACSPVVEKLIEEIQNVEVLHLDETHWEVQGDLQWLWVAISGKTAVYHIGSRRKEELLYLVTEAFMGWLVTDGYLSYRSFPKRQRCLAHLIRKAIALTGAVNKKAAQIGSWILNSLKELITGIAEGLDQSSKTISDNLFMLETSCFIGYNKSHEKLKALSKEILNDWDAVIAFVNNPDLPPTNNEAERALRHAVIGRRISYGTRTAEGSLAYSSLLSVIETCRLRNINPWTYICEVIKEARKGLSPPPVPTG
jgi:IS1 family transposase